MSFPPLDVITAQLPSGLTPYQMIGIPIAIIGAVLMSLSAVLQHRGVSKVDALLGASGAGGLGFSQLVALLQRPSWLIGTVLIGVAIVLQLGALVFAPLVVVQPLGVVSLIVTTLISARQARVRMSRAKIVAVLTSVLGVAGFVSVAATSATESPLRAQQVITVLVIAAIVTVITAISFFALRNSRYRTMFYILAGGVLYGFVATFAKVILARFRDGHFDWLSLLCLVGLLLTVLVGGYFVQTAYASGSTEMVIAGLTVVDPIIAVTVGITVLGETSGASFLTYGLFAVFGLIAIWGVFLLNFSQSDVEIAAARRHALGVGSDGNPPFSEGKAVPESGGDTTRPRSSDD